MPCGTSKGWNSPVPRTIRTTGDRGLDRELDLLWEQIKQITVVEAPQSTVVTPPFEIGLYVRTIAEQPNSGVSGDVTFTDSGGTEITQNDQNFDFYSVPLCDDPPEDIAGGVVASVPTITAEFTDTFTNTTAADITWDPRSVHSADTAQTYSSNNTSSTLLIAVDDVLKQSVLPNGLKATPIYSPSAQTYAISMQMRLRVDGAGINWVLGFPFLNVKYDSGTDWLQENAVIWNGSGWDDVPFYRAGYYVTSGPTKRWVIIKVTWVWDDTSEPDPIDWIGHNVDTVLVSSTTTLTIDQWYTLIWMNSAAEKALWVDGVKVCTTSDNDAPGSDSTKRYMAFGQQAIYSTTGNYTWEMDNLSGGPYTLSAADAGDSTYASRCDHVHEGVHSVARRTASGTAGTAFTGDVVLQEDGGIDLGEDVANNRIKIASGYRRRLMLMGA